LYFWQKNKYTLKAIFYKRRYMNKKILIVRFRRVGDAIISSTLCSSLKQSFPDSEIHYILNESIAPLFKHDPNIDKLISFSDYDMESFPRYLRKVRKIVKETDYDIIIDTRSTIKTLFFSLFSLRTKYRIGRKKAYNALVQNYRVDNRYKGDKDNVGLTLMLLDPLIKEFKIKKDKVFRLYYTEEEKERFRNYMISSGIDFSKPVMVCAVTARQDDKIWPSDKMKEILNRILRKYDMQLIFNYGGEKEKSFAEKMYKEMGENKQIFINIEAKSLRELIAMFANADFFFGNEGGPRHISQALNVPSFAIYNPTAHLNNWLPNKSERFQGIELRDIDPVSAENDNLSYVEKFKLIDVDPVWTRLEKMLI